MPSPRILIAISNGGCDRCDQNSISARCSLGWPERPFLLSLMRVTLMRFQDLIPLLVSVTLSCAKERILRSDFKSGGGHASPYCSWTCECGSCFYCMELFWRRSSGIGLSNFESSRLRQPCRLFYSR